VLAFPISPQWAYRLCGEMRSSMSTAGHDKTRGYLKYSLAYLPPEEFHIRCAASSQP
jgi:hypothetical protein